MPRGSTWLVTPEKFLRPEQVAVLRRRLDEERLLGTEVRDRYLVRNAGILECLLATGLRVSEGCALVVGDIFLDVGAASVLVRRGKGGKARLVAISERLAAYFVQFIAWKSTMGEPTESESVLFLSERGGKMSRSAVHRIWKAALKRAGLPTRWGVHATRHSFGVEIYRKTKDLRLTQKLLGHSSPAVTQVYANLLDEEMRRGVEMVWA